MKFQIIVRPAGPGKFKAVALDVPELSAEAESEVEAVALVRKALVAWLGAARVFKVEVRLPTGVPNPWLDYAGAFKDDPTYDDFLEEIRKARERDDSE